METNLHRQGPMLFWSLRENHSGMETYSVRPFLLQFLQSCVRTIVVWKRMFARLIAIYWSVLRENHSGMETGLAWSNGFVWYIRCVRTIVVWKLDVDAIALTSLTVA